MPLGHYRSPDRVAFPGSAFVVGETLVDLVAATPGNPATRTPGGSPANVAVQLSHQGAAVGMSTRVGADTDGKLLLDWFAEAGVGLLGEHRDNQPTNQAVVTSATDDEYTFVMNGLLPATLPRVPADAVVMHTGSLVTSDPRTAQQVLARIHQARATATITYDPNIRPAAIIDPAQTRDLVTGFVQLADVVKLSDADARWINPDADPLELVESWLASESRPAVVVLTAGADGLIVFAGEHIVDVAAEPGPVVDTVGAGDAVMASIIQSLWQAGALGAENRHLLHGLEWGGVSRLATSAVSAAAATLAHHGATPVSVSSSSLSQHSHTAVDVASAEGRPVASG